MHILSLEAENFKKLRIVDITPTLKHRIVQVTGRNAQGKTSVLDALWAGLQGKRATPEKPVRKGADKSRITFRLGDLKTGIRTIAGRRIIDGNRTQTIELQNVDGTKYSSPQAMLDDLIGELAFDPLEFVRMDTKKQVTTLRQVAKVDYDFEAATKANTEDFQARTIVNREVKRLETEVSGITVQDGLPKEKQDDTAILASIQEVDALNLKARQLDEAKRDAQKQLDEAKIATTNARFKRQQLRDAKSRMEAQILELQKSVAKADGDIATLQANEIDPLEATEARIEAEVDAMPSGQFADVMALTQQLQQAQLVNREIDKRTRREKLEAELEAKRKESATLTRQIDKRDEKKAEAISKAKLPVEGLTFDEENVLMNGIPLENLGEAEQIRLSTLVAMAANPKLRVLRIMHGEALDDDNLAVLAQLAEEHDFQIWMARVDSSGKVGIVMEDGEVKTVNDGEEENG